MSGWMIVGRSNISKLKSVSRKDQTLFAVIAWITSHPTILYTYIYVNYIIGVYQSNA